MSKIARRQFIQLSAVAAAGTLLRPGQEAQAQDMPKVEESDSMAQAMKYTHDASTSGLPLRARIQLPHQTCDKLRTRCRVKMVRNGGHARSSRVRSLLVQVGVQFGRQKPNSFMK